MMDGEPERGWKQKENVNMQLRKQESLGSYRQWWYLTWCLPQVGRHSPSVLPRSYHSPAKSPHSHPTSKVEGHIKHQFTVTQKAHKPVLLLN